MTSDVIDVLVLQRYACPGVNEKGNEQAGWRAASFLSGSALDPGLFSVLASQSCPSLSVLS